MPPPDQNQNPLLLSPLPSALCDHNQNSPTYRKMYARAIDTLAVLSECRLQPSPPSYPELRGVVDGLLQEICHGAGVLVFGGLSKGKGAEWIKRILIRFKTIQAF